VSENSFDKDTGRFTESEEINQFKIAKTTFETRVDA
jgi:hypothetical protein